MDDNLPSSIPENGGDNKPTANKTSDKQNPKPEKEIKPRRGKPRKILGFSETKFREFAGYFILIGWLWYDLIDSHGRIVKLCFLAVSLAIAQGLAFSFLKSWRKAIVLWVILEILSGFVVWENSRPEPEPHFTVSFGTDDTFPILLTNECLFQGRFEKTGTNASKNAVFFNSFAHSCIIIPIDPSKTNVVFDFGVQNDSTLIVHDLSMAVGFPSEWEIGIDTSKWKTAREHLIIPGWELWYTNLQSWAANEPSPLFPSDSIQFSITNFTVPVYKNPTSKNGVISFIIRSTGFEEFISANLIFFPKTNSFIKPILAKMEKGTNGLWHISITPKEIEDSQK